MSTEFETTSIAFDADTGVGSLTLDRPDVMNAINDQLRSDIVAGLEELDSKNDATDGIPLRVIVIDGAEGNFCAGADIPTLSERSPGDRSEPLPYELIRDFPVPVIAKISGYCLGGGFELALSCDFRLAHRDARVGLPEVDVGQLPGVGGVQLLRELAGPAVAEETAMLGEYINADRAHELNLIDRVYGAEFDDAVVEFAETIASKPPLAIQAIKRSAAIATQVGLEGGITHDRQQFERLVATEDHKEGARAFAEDDYEPTFRGR